MCLHNYQTIIVCVQLFSGIVYLKFSVHFKYLKHECWVQLLSFILLLFHVQYVYLVIVSCTVCVSRYCYMYSMCILLLFHVQYVYLVIVTCISLFLGSIFQEMNDNHNEAIPNDYSHNEDQSLDWCFPLPELPQGKEMIIKILSTWGDKYYVGLTGIDIFTDNGEKANINKVTRSVNLLPCSLYMYGWFLFIECFIIIISSLLIMFPIRSR